MTDAELVAAVAKRLGWTFSTDGCDFESPPCCHPKSPHWDQPLKDTPQWPAYILDGALPPWLTSIDAALGVLDKTKPLEIVWDESEQRWDVIYVDSLKKNESLPHAILLAFLESQEEKP